MKAFLILSLSLIVTACGQTRRTWIAQNCTVSASEKQGYTDARHARRTGLRALRQKCESGNLDALTAAYEKGYKKGDGPAAGTHVHGHDAARDFVHTMDSEQNPQRKTTKKGQDTTSK